MKKLCFAESFCTNFLTKALYIHTLFIAVFFVYVPHTADGQDIPPPSKPSSTSLEGKIIKNIYIRIRPVFEGENINIVYKAANAVKAETKEYIIKQEMFIKEGDPYNQFRVYESERQLRSRKFLRYISITGKETEDGMVDLYVDAQDNWTLIPQVSYSSSSGASHRAFGISESNLFGYGKRLEVLNRETDNRRTLETVWDDQRVLGTWVRFLAANFQRDDGDRSVFLFGRPYRSLVDPYAWSVDTEVSDGIGRLFQHGDERYIYRLISNNFNLNYSVARGLPSVEVFRYNFGISGINEEFKKANEKYYDILELDPSNVSNDPRFLAKNRRFYGPNIGIESIQQDFISMNYIDRFEIFEDFNLGDQYLLSFLIAPDIFGSEGNSVNVNGNKSFGIRMDRHSFFRFDMGVNTRVYREHIENSLIRGEMRYYSVLGTSYFKNLFLGKHTFAANFSADLGSNLDADREFLIGGDNGIRGYKARAFSGDKRIQLNIEDRVHFADDVFELISVGGAVFADAGGSSQNSYRSLFSDEIYSNVGMGLRIGFPRSSGGGILRFDIALPLRDGPDGTKQFEPRIVIGAGQLFSSKVRSEVSGASKANVEIGFDR
jgi:outer membrane protein assembly factor BamA